MKTLALAAGLCVCAGLNALSTRLAPGFFPIQARLALASDSAVETAALFSLGMRRLVADIGLVRMLIYYGSAEQAPQGAHHGHDHGTHNADRSELAWGSGHYPELGPRALAVLDADPTMSYAALYAAGALSFNLNRPDDGLKVLEYALSRDSNNREYQGMLAAVGFHKKGDSGSVIRLLEPVAASPDCPTMLKHLLAFLYVRTGDHPKAIVLYTDILETSRDEGYRNLAKQALQRLR